MTRFDGVVDCLVFGRVPALICTGSEFKLGVTPQPKMELEMHRPDQTRRSLLKVLATGA